MSASVFISVCVTVTPFVVAAIIELGSHAQPSFLSCLTVKVSGYDAKFAHYIVAVLRFYGAGKAPEFLSFVLWGLAFPFSLGGADAFGRAMWLKTNSRQCKKRIPLTPSDTAS